MGKPLNAYICAFVKVGTLYVEEARENFPEVCRYLSERKCERNLVALLPLINEKTYPLYHFVPTTSIPTTLLREAIDYNIRKAIEHGIDPIIAIRAATINTARHYTCVRWALLLLGTRPTS